MAIDARDVVIWSADVIETDLFKALGHDGFPIQFIKLTPGRMIRMGLEKIAYIQDHYNVLVFADTKISGVGHEAVESIEPYLEHRPWMANIMAGSLSTGIMESQSPDDLDTLKRFADACRKAGTRPCAVTVLTSKTPTIVSAEFNKRTAIEQVLLYASYLVPAGFTDMVCSPLEAAAIRSDSSFDSLELNIPGIRMLGDDTGDQSRITTPAEALVAGADRLVIGTSLTKGDLSSNFTRIADHLKEGVNA
jgi:orotidine-5'-phosphate decarboxylase